MKHFTTLVLSMFTLALAAQYTTPGTGGTYTLDDLVSLSDGAVTNGDTGYLVNESLTISEGDTLYVFGEMARIATDTVINVAGAFQSYYGAVFTSLGDSVHFGGFRFEESAHVEIFETTISYGGGLKVITPDFIIEASNLTHHIGGEAEFAVLSFSNGKPSIINCVFTANEYSAISSPANGEVAPLIENCTIEGNVTANANRPQINLGPTGPDTTFIRMNSIVGADSLGEVGGISIALLLGGEAHAVIEQNTIENNRYGINLYGSDLTSLVHDNQINNNDNEDNPLFGGSGISITGFGDDNYHEITGNTITGNLWGITLINDAHANLGDTATIGPGNNSFDDNGNEGALYALFNNTANTQMAQGNCWIRSNPEATLAEVEDVISHVVDDPELGEVIFDPLGNCSPDATNNLSFGDVAKLYPNPAANTAYIELNRAAQTLTVFDLTGRMTESRNLSNEGLLVKLNTRNYANGLYIVQIEGNNYRVSRKLIVNGN